VKLQAVRERAEIGYYPQTEDGAGGSDGPGGVPGKQGKGRVILKCQNGAKPFITWGSIDTRSWGRRGINIPGQAGQDRSREKKPVASRDSL